MSSTIRKTIARDSKNFVKTVMIDIVSALNASDLSLNPTGKRQSLLSIRLPQITVKMIYTTSSKQPPIFQNQY